MENLVTCPICTLYLHPGMSLQTHLDTHPKDMIIQALLMANTGPPSSSQNQSTPSCTTNPIPVTTPAPLSPQIYQTQQQHQQSATPHHQQINKIVKSDSTTYNNISNNKPHNVIFGKPSPVTSNSSGNYRIQQISIDALPMHHSSAQNPHTITLKPAYCTTTSLVAPPKLSAMPNPQSAIRCIQNTEKNIMIVNSSSTQFIQQAIPVPVSKNNSKQPTLLAHPSGQKITIIPRYTSEKYSGPPPPYSTAISNVSGSSTTARNSIIDLTNHHSYASGSQQDRNMAKHHLMITTNPQKIVDVSQNESGELMITEQMLNDNQSEMETELAKSVVVDYMGNQQLPETYAEEEYTYVEEVTVPMEYRSSGECEINKSDEPQFDEIKFEDEEVLDEPSKEPEIQRIMDQSRDNEKSVKVISNVKLSSNDVIILLNDSESDSTANAQESEKKDQENQDQVQEEILENLKISDKKESEKEEPVPSTSKVALEAQSQAAAAATTSVIRMTSSEEMAQKASTTSSATPNSTVASSNNNSFLFNSNRLKINKQPKKLVVKLKKPLILDSEENKAQTKSKEEENVQKPATTEKPTKETPKESLEIPVEENNEEIVESSTVKDQTEHFTVTFLESELTFEKEKINDSNFNQNTDSDMDIEDYQPTVKNEVEDIVVVKTEINSLTSSSKSCNSNNIQVASSLFDESAGPSNRENNNNLSNLMPITSAANLESQRTSSVPFLYQNERVRFSPPLSPIVYMQTYSTHSTSQEIPQKMEECVTSVGHNNWNNNIIISNATATTTSTLNDSTRYTPSSIYEDNRSSYTDLDMCTKTNSNSLSGNSRGDMSNGQTRAPSLDSLNIRTDEKMPARGEISEQESNGDMEQPWHQFYPLQAYPSSYDLSTAQECWNLSKHEHDSQNACDSNNIIPNVIINFPPLNHQDEDIKTPDLLKEIILAKPDSGAITLTDSNHSDLNAERHKHTRPRTYRCPDCLKVFSQLKERRIHMIKEHNHPTGKITKPTATVTSTQTSKSLSLLEQSIPSTSSSLLAAPVLLGEPIENPDLSVVKTETVTSNSAIVTVKNEMSRIIMNYSMLENELKLDVKPVIDGSNMLISSEPSTSQLAVASTSSSMLPLGIKIKRTYVCATCKEEFRTLRLFDKHLRIHPAECVACGKTFHNWVNFSIHLKRHLNIKNHVCRFCSKRFVIRQKLVEHMRVHTGSAPLKCVSCGERFRRYSNLIQHRNRVHLNKKPSKKDFVCDCGEIFQSKAKLEWHQETHSTKPKACPHCRERFTHRNSLTRHIRLSHTDKYIFEKSKTVNCPICQETYLSSSIKAHMITHSVGKKEFCCSICSKAFSTKWNLKQHNWTHASRSSKPFQCTVCPSAFIRENDFITHQNAHKSIKPYTCNYCGCQFVRKYNWLRHSREHEKEKKFTCNICGKKFHRAYYLTEHKRIHTGERPFACNICGKTSATKTNHNKHIKIHHARDPLTAEG